jgi:apolipoprotein N-acyltransferase
VAKLLSLSVWIFGAVCIVIALVHIAFGPAAIPGSIPVNATLDSEDRFYASLFGGFGAALIWCSRNLDERRGLFHALMAVFFIGGLARFVSYLQMGLPHPLFQFLWGVELILPWVLIGWLRTVHPPSRA